MDPLDSLQARLGHRFAQPALLRRALTHRSHSADHNERLEFLGDAVLNLAVSTLLFARLAEAPEGDLTRVRAHLVREDTLHQIALALQLPQALRLSEGEARSGGAQKASMLADATEALVGAICLDAGYAAAEAVVHRLMADRMAGADAGRWAKDAKSALQEWLQGRKLPTPRYEILATHGQAHAQSFDVSCSVPQRGVVQTGHGRSRRQAEQDAAARALAVLQQQESAAAGAGSAPAVARTPPPTAPAERRQSPTPDHSRPERPPRPMEPA